MSWPGRPSGPRPGWRRCADRRGRPARPATAIRPPRKAPASAAGEGLALVVNTSAGTASARLARRLAADLPQAAIIETGAGDLAARLRGSRPHELLLDGKRRRLWLYFVGNCRYEPQGMAPAYRPNLADGCLDIRVVEATVLARSRLVAAVLTGTLGRSRVYHSWQAGSVDVRGAGGQPIWLSTDGEVATAETGFTHGKHPRGLVVYRKQAPLHAGHMDVPGDAVRVDDGQHRDQQRANRHELH
jgi:hypothetical protein